jgi:hypothetical protein
MEDVTVPALRRLTRIHWDSIVEGIDKGLTVPFLGAGVNADSNGYAGLPMGGEVARRLVEKLIDRKVKNLGDLVGARPGRALRRYPDLGRARVEDLARVALHIELEGGYPALVDYLKEIIADEQREPSEPLRAIARLPFKLMVTTNYDRLLERAFTDQALPAPLVLSQPVKGFSPSEMTEWTSKIAAAPRLIYKLHGSFDDPEPNLVVSEDDYIEFMGIAADDVAGVPKLIRARITTSVLLFLGYGLEDWDVRSIHKLLIGRNDDRSQRMSFAIQKDPSRFWVQFWKDKNVTIYNLDLHEFAGQLEQQYERRH